MQVHSIRPSDGMLDNIGQPILGYVIATGPLGNILHFKSTLQKAIQLCQYWCKCNCLTIGENPHIAITINKLFTEHRITFRPRSEIDCL